MFPESGQKEEIISVRIRSYRYLIEGNYKIVYKIYPAKDQIQITAIFDIRLNPDKLKF